MTDITADKRFVTESLAALWEDDVERAAERLWAEDAEWRGAHPLNEMAGRAAIARVHADLRRALPDGERRDLCVVGGTYRGTRMVACMGHYVGRWERDWLGMPASGGVLALRYGEVHELKDGRIKRSSCLWDVLDAMHRCGPQGAGFHPLAPAYGTEMRWMAPVTGDGASMEPRSAEEGTASLAQTLAMHDTLAEYGESGREAAELGRRSLIEMPQAEHWHPKMMWYGPAGIGTGRGLAGFVDAHQLPFRRAFPNRQGGGQLLDGDALSDGGGHYVRLGEGAYSVTGGWPSVRAVHGGADTVADLFGTGPTGRPVGMRVMDFYLHHEGLIRENWVPLDVPHLLLQMGVDVFARMELQVGRNRMGLAPS